MRPKSGRAVLPLGTHHNLLTIGGTTAFAATRQAEASASPCPTCTPTPNPQFAERWLTDADRAQLVSPALQTPVAALALEYAQRDGIRATGPQPATVELSYPADDRLEPPRFAFGC